MYKLMIVDDERIIVEGLKNVIDWDGLGFEIVSCADNGEEAIEKVNENTPDVIITDIRMPIMDGIDLIKSLRDKGYKKIKIVILSGYDDFEYARNGIRLGVVDYLLKPTDPDKLEDTLRKIKIGLDCEMEALRQEQGNNAKLNLSTPLLITDITEKETDKDNRRNGRICMEIVDFLKNNYTQEITLEILAEKFFLTPNYLGNIFKKTLGKSFKEYLIHLRIKKAKELIALNRYKLYEIGEMIGYSNYEYFRKIFKKYTGINPSEK